MLRPVVGVLVGLAVAVGVLAPTPVPAQESRASRPSVAFFGDSIGYNAEVELRAAIEPLYRFTYHAAGGSAIEYWRDDVAALVRGRNRPDELLIELGTADAGWDHSSRRFERDVRGLLDVVSPRVACIRWFDIRGEPSLFRFVNAHAVAFNRILWRVAEDYPNVEIMHYSFWATLAGPGDYWWPDHLHHNAAGRRELARMARQAAVGCDPARTTGPFWDVPDSADIADAVAWMAEAGITTGYSNATFRAVVGSIRPTVSRSQMAVFLWHLAGSPTGFAPHPWRDGPPRVARALDWGAATGVIGGFADRTFRPTRPATRGDLVTFLWRMAGSPTGLPEHPWIDGTRGLAGPLNWAASTGLMHGYADGGFHPADVITRGQTAKALYAYHLLVPPDTPTTSGAPTTIPPSVSTPATLPPPTVPSTSLAPTTVPPPTVPAPTTVPAPPSVPTTVP